MRLALYSAAAAKAVLVEKNPPNRLLVDCDELKRILKKNNSDRYCGL